jgi:hypothetical protein
MEFGGIWHLLLLTTMIVVVNEGINTTETLNIESRKFAFGKVISVVLLLTITLFWIWALSPLAPSGHPDKLDDSSFADEAKVLCGIAEEKLEEIPYAFSVKSPDERADQIDQGTAIYRNLLSELLLIAPEENTRDGRLVRLWIADYALYLDDRDNYAEQFRDGIDEAFTVTKKGSRWVTDPVDEFAKGNKIRECLVPLDV